ncbi:hypothetical protein P9112_011214 [Eukaryota sp. TZLM1-RC]
MDDDSDNLFEVESPLYFETMLTHLDHVLHEHLVDKPDVLSDKDVSMLNQLASQWRDVPHLKVFGCSLSNNDTVSKESLNQTIPTQFSNSIPSKAEDTEEVADVEALFHEHLIGEFIDVVKPHVRNLVCSAFSESSIADSSDMDEPIRRISSAPSPKNEDGNELETPRSFVSSSEGFIYGGHNTGVGSVNPTQFRSQSISKPCHLKSLSDTSTSCLPPVSILDRRRSRIGCSDSLSVDGLSLSRSKLL